MCASFIKRVAAWSIIVVLMVTATTAAASSWWTNAICVHSNGFCAIFQWENHFHLKNLWDIEQELWSRTCSDRTYCLSAPRKRGTLGGSFKFFFLFEQKANLPDWMWTYYEFIWCNLVCCIHFTMHINQLTNDIAHSMDNNNQKRLSARLFLSFVVLVTYFF